MSTHGIHHVTAICSDAQANVDFYVGILGLRLVKRTVNFDDPGAYHLYYGDPTGSPGSILTFFPYPDGRRARSGSGQVVATTFAVPIGAIDAWIMRFSAEVVDFDNPSTRLGQRFLPFRDQDGLPLELIETDDFGSQPWTALPSDFAIRGIDSVTISSSRFHDTTKLMEEHLGFRKAASEGIRTRWLSGEGGSTTRVDVLDEPEREPAHGGHGSVHHVAFRIPDEQKQLELRTELNDHQIHPSPVMDRTYFRSIYFREPGGVLFEVATDGPGMAFDESPNAIGEQLRLPKQYEALRTRILATLPDLRVPEVKV
jgi:glyoxalase family protein